MQKAQGMLLGENPLVPVYTIWKWPTIVIHSEKNVLYKAIHLSTWLCALYAQTLQSKPKLIRSLLPPKQVCEVSYRSTRSNLVQHTLRPLRGRTVAGCWSIHQFDRSVLPTVVPIWNSLSPEVVGFLEKEPTKTFCQCVHQYIKSI